MKLLRTVMALAVACFALLLPAQESHPATGGRMLKDRTARGTLSDRQEMVRGDTGKWNDKATLRPAPPIQQKPNGMSLDDWADQLAEQKSITTAKDDNWLLFRSRQLDDNDRLWVKSIDRKSVV